VHAPTQPLRTTGVAATAPGFGSGTRLLNRELSWVDFNARVLALAEDEGIPLLERVKFLAIYATNLDEFFQIRVAGLHQQATAQQGITSRDGLTPVQQLDGIRAATSALALRHSAALHERIAPALRAAGVDLACDGLSADEQAHLDGLFDEGIFPVLTPLAVDPGRPFPFVSSLSLNLAVVVVDPGDPPGVTRFARVKIPPSLPRFVPLPDAGRFVPLERVVADRLDRLFTGMTVVASYPFRVTRNADFDLEEEEAPDLLDAIEAELRRRRFGRVVRLEVDRSMPADVLSVLRRELDVAESDTFCIDGLLDLGGLWQLHGLDRPDLKDDPWPAITPPALEGLRGSPALFDLLREGDVLVHHPYESFEATVQAFVETAAIDPDVLAIKQTLYRTSADSPIVDALITAAERGKQAVALVELKARFDEAANIARARKLEEAGVHVVYGLLGLKTHAKLCLVVRQEPGGIRRYAHIGTGNYNASTARIYEDLGRLTADPDAGADISELFNVLTGYSRQRDYRQLIAAPHRMRDALLAEIAAEAAAGADGAITIKVNSLVDAAIIEALYEASVAGTEVDLIVRGVCCLRAGVEGLSGHVRVRSIVGRYLEHSRIYRFGREPRHVRRYIGSADAMPRNLDRRVEALTPIRDERAAARIDEILEVCRTDDVLAWELDDATWRKVETVKGEDAQATLRALAVQRSRPHRTP
jgi:polyphosphate kinase